HIFPRFPLPLIANSALFQICLPLNVPCLWTRLPMKDDKKRLSTVSLLTPLHPRFPTRCTLRWQPKCQPALHMPASTVPAYSCHSPPGFSWLAVPKSVPCSPPPILTHTNQYPSQAFLLPHTPLTSSLFVPALPL
ncbi:hypothetical protein KUCAC02_033891, partial [Chaenocephalus aceratus]